MTNHRQLTLASSFAAIASVLLLCGCLSPVVPAPDPDVTDVSPSEAPDLPSDPIVPSTPVVPDTPPDIPEPPPEEYIPAEMVGRWQAGYYSDDEGWWMIIDEFGGYQTTTEEGVFIEAGDIDIVGSTAHITPESGQPVAVTWSYSELDEYGVLLRFLQLGDLGLTG